MAGNRIAGTCFVKADGKSFQLGGSWTCSVDNYEREGISGLSGVAGYSEKPRVPFFEGEFLTTSDFKLSDLEAIKSATIQCEQANGDTYMLRQAWCCGKLEVKSEDGTCTVRFEGMSGEHLKP